MEILGKHQGLYFIKEGNNQRLINQNTLDAYKDIQSDGTAKSQRLRILFLIRRHNGITRQEINKELNISINAVCGRVKELLNSSSIYESGDKIGESGKKNAVLKAYKIIEQNE